MATSLNRKARRRRKAGALVATGAATAVLAAGSLTAPQAQALSLGDLNLPPLVAACNAGGAVVSQGPVSADCSGANKAVVATVGDAILGLFLPDLGLSLAGMNGALATPGVELNLQNPLKPNLVIPGSASIKGTGYNTALVILGGEASAKSDYFLAGAVALAGGGGKASADSLFGASVATAVGRPAAQVGPIGAPALRNSATAQSLPLGFAIANSSNILVPNGSGALAAERHATATALAGIASASSAMDGSERAVCTAAYGAASVTAKDGSNVRSCTSILFIFQQSQVGGDPVVYAIKNPFAIGLVSPFGDDLASFIANAIDTLAPDEVPDVLIDLIAGKFVPEFQSDIVRISFENGTPKLGTDLPEWLGGLFAGLGSQSGPTNTTAQRTAFVAPGQAPSSVSQKVVDDGDEAADVVLNDPVQVNVDEEEKSTDLMPSTLEVQTEESVIKAPVEIVNEETAKETADKYPTEVSTGDSTEGNSDSVEKISIEG